MVIQKTPTKIDKIVSLKIGQHGENLATDIKMDVSDWVAIHPDAHYHCLFKRPGEVQVLPVLSSFEDGILTWTVRAWECGVIGVGYLEVRAVDSDTGMVAKSRVIPCSVEDSIIDDEGPVSPEMSWVEEVIEAKNDAEAARDEAQEVVAGAIDGIEAAGAAQVGAVNSAGSTQVGAVQDKGEEVLDSIPDDYSALSGEVSDLKSALNKSTPIASHFFYPGKEPYIDTNNRTITFYANCPFVVHGKSYGSVKSTNTVVEIPEYDHRVSYFKLFLDVEHSDNSNLVFALHSLSVTLPENYAYVGQINNQGMIFSFPFNVNIDGTLYYALGSNVLPRLNDLENAIIIDCSYQTFSGGYIKAADGTVGTNSNTGYTSYIPVSGFGKIQNPVDHSATYQMAFYDENKSYVSGETINRTAPYVWTIPVPSNAKYARLSFYLDVEESFYAKGIINNLEAYIESKQDRDGTKLRGKKLGIVGDSISTFSGYIPSGYVSFYPRNTIQNVEQTWWKQLLNETGMTLCVNASWSGSTICGDTTRSDGYVGCSDARVSALTGANSETPDIIICFIGINDFGKNNGLACGTYDGKTAVSTETVINNITTAYGVLLKKLQTAYPNARIFVCRIMPEQFSSEMSESFANGFPNINPNDNVSLPELNERIEEIANAFNCGIIPMDKCGITFFNLATYTGDMLHPNALLAPMMCQVAKQAILNVF